MKFSPRVFLRSELIRNTSVLISGTVMAQLISILLHFALRRLYPVESFGTYSVYMSLIGMLAVISTLRYDDAIVLPVKDKDSANLLFLAMIFNLTITLLAFATIVLFGKQLLAFFDLPKGLSISILYLVPAGAFLLNTYQSFNYWLIRKKRYTNVSVNKMIRRGTEGVFQISMAILKKRNGLILSDIIGQMVNASVTIFQSIRSGLKFQMLSMDKVRYVAKKYFEFPKFNLIPAFMSACSFLLPPIFINKFYSTETAGYFDASRLILSIPMALVATSISNVLLQKLSDKYNSRHSLLGDIRPFFYIVFPICIIEIIVISFFGPVLFKIAFGNDYGISGSFSRIMVWSFALNFMISSFSCLFFSLRKIKIYSLWQLLYFSLIISLLLFKDLDFTSFLKVYVAIEVFSYMVLALIMIKIVVNFENSIKEVKIK